MLILYVLLTLKLPKLSRQYNSNGPGKLGNLGSSKEIQLHSAPFQNVWGRQATLKEQGKAIKRMITWARQVGQSGQQLRNTALFCTISERMEQTGYAEGTGKSNKEDDHMRKLLTLKVLNFWKFTSYCSLKPLWSYLADPTSPIPSHCASIVVTSTLRVNAEISQSQATVHHCHEHSMH